MLAMFGGYVVARSCHASALRIRMARCIIMKPITKTERLLATLLSEAGGYARMRSRVQISKSAIAVPLS